MTTRFIDRAIRSSVARAQRMQPGRVRRVAEETLYSSPAQRPLVEDVRSARDYLVSTGLGTAAASTVAVRRTDRTVAVTREGSMAAEIDGRSLETVSADAGPLARAAAAVGAAVWAHPPALMALAAADRRVDESVSRDLAECCGRIVFGAEVTEPGVGVVAGEGVVAAGSTAIDAVARLEAAERLATITLHLPDR